MNGSDAVTSVRRTGGYPKVFQTRYSEDLCVRASRRHTYEFSCEHPPSRVQTDVYLPYTSPLILHLGALHLLFNIAEFCIWS